MRWLSFFVLVLIFLSCAPAPKKVEKKVERQPPKIEKPRKYLPPVKGTPVPSGRGVFIKAKCGSFVRAVEGGKVAYAGKSINNFGWVVIVEQRDGLVAVYGRLGELWVRTGERVRARQVLGRVGRYKNTCGVYYEVRDRRGRPLKTPLR
ncbi:MAG: M23 family metallopeptidase [Aquificae bacterium]|nr:M23 family metallopeptidase [Aquificota bacterium]